MTTNTEAALTGPELHLVRRTDKNGKPSVAPFIDGWNVWDIPPEHWCEAVERAILSAYELGWQACNAAHAEVRNHAFPTGAHFKEKT